MSKAIAKRIDDNGSGWRARPHLWLMGSSAVDSGHRRGGLAYRWFAGCKGGSSLDEPYFLGTIDLAVGRYQASKSGRRVIGRRPISRRNRDAYRGAPSRTRSALGPRYRSPSALEIWYSSACAVRRTTSGVPPRYFAQGDQIFPAYVAAGGGDPTGDDPCPHRTRSTSR